MPAVDEELDSADEAGFIGDQKHCCRGNFGRVSSTARVATPERTREYRQRHLAIFEAKGTISVLSSRDEEEVKVSVDAHPDRRANDEQQI